MNDQLIIYYITFISNVFSIMIHYNLITFSDSIHRTFNMIALYGSMFYYIKLFIYLINMTCIRIGNMKNGMITAIFIIISILLKNNTGYPTLGHLKNNDPIIISLLSACLLFNFLNFLLIIILRRLPRYIY